MLTAAPPSLLPALFPALPEIIIAIGAMVALMVGVYRTHHVFRDVTRLSVLVLAVAFAALMLQDAGRVTTFSGMFVSDSFAHFMKALVLIGSAASILMSRQYLIDREIAKFEYPILIVLATLGMMMMISANDLLALYIGLELQSLSLYVLAAFDRDRMRSSEAGLKYFVLGALSSGMLLYGISLVYGFTGTTSFPLLAERMSMEGTSLGLTAGVMFMVAGLAFKISAVPFHMWTPDVYEGSPTPVTALFAAAPKVAAMALLMRVMMGTFPALVPDWQIIIEALAIGSMLVGAFVALVQTNIKRLLAYSSIGHVGYALVGLAAGTAQGVESVLVYMAIYMLMTLGTFACVLSMRRREGMSEDIADLAGLARSRPGMAFAMAVFMFSLAGIPLLAGFFGKWFVFVAAVEAGLIPLAIIGVVASVVGAYYYLRIVKIMYFDEPAEAFIDVPGRSMGGIIFGTAVLNSPVSFFVIGWLLAVANNAAGALLP